MSIAPGTIFGSDFRVERPLAAGAMGEVYIAEQLSTGKARALKVMNVTFVADEALREMFDQEARVGSRIDSEHVVEVVAAGIDGESGMPWLAMELLRGVDLTRRIVGQGPLREGELLTVFEQICHAMGAAHRAGIVHRDLKPDNIYLADAKQVRLAYMVKILDFGIAKVIAEGRATSTDGAGTPLWMAPEQMRTGPIDARADVWALGLIAFYALTGRHYWRSGENDDASLAEVFREVAHAPLPLASTRAREWSAGSRLPLGFDGWFARCVTRDPELRFANADELWAGLRKLLDASAVSQFALGATNARGGSIAPENEASGSTSSYLPGALAPEERKTAGGARLLLGVALIGVLALAYGGWRHFASGVATTSIRVKSGMYLLTAVNGGGMGRGLGVVSTDATSVGPSERFVLVPLGDRDSHAFALRAPNGHFLSANYGGGHLFGLVGDEVAVRADAPTWGPNERFRIAILGWDAATAGCTSYPAAFPRGCPVVSLQTPDGNHYLSVPVDPLIHAAPVSPVLAERTHASGWETFFLPEFRAGE